MKSEKKNIEPLKISCDTHDCENNLHCFRISKKIAKKQVEGSCSYCGANVVDWIRVRDRRLEDLEFTIENLKKEGIRHYFWHFKLTTKHKEFISTLLVKFV
ncbi:MAG: hypothetical protein Q8N03_18110 [Ignavibacteria bacterium]|nr:hypothetical protein [Ignavibacteria bacterium]